MKKSDSFLNLVFWVIVGSVFATGAVLLNPDGNWGQEKMSADSPQVSLASEQR